MKPILDSLSFVAVIAIAAAAPDLFDRVQPAWLSRRWGDATPVRHINAHYSFEYTVTKQPDLPGFYLFLTVSRGPLEGPGPVMDEVCKHDIGFAINNDRWRTFCRPRVIRFSATEGDLNVKFHLAFTGINPGDPKCRLEVPIQGVPREEFLNDRFYAQRRNLFRFISVDAFIELRLHQRVPFKFEWFANLLNHGVIEKGIDPQTGLEVFETRPINMMTSSVDYLTSLLEREFHL